MERKTQIVISCFFSGFIVVPLLLFLFVPDRETSIFEKRMLAQKPAPVTDMTSLSKYPEKYEEYFGDQFGLRDKLVALHSLFYVKVLKVSPEPTVILGKDNWLFYNSGTSFSEQKDIREEREHLFSLWLHSVKDRRDWLNEKGIKYLMVVAPDKFMVYPEKMPERLKGVANVSLIDQFVDTLQGRSVSSNVLFLKNVLNKAKEKQQVYLQTDTHWNSVGAFTAYTAIMQRIQQWFPEIKPLDESRLERIPQTYAGDLSILLHLNNVLTEETSTLKVIDRCSDTQYRKLVGFVHPIKDFRKPFYLPEENGCERKPLTAIVIHDSFGLYLRSFFNESFGRVIYSHYANLGHLKELIKEIKPDLIIDQRVARNVYGLFRPDEEIEKNILTKRFAKSTDVMLHIDAASDVKRLVNSHDITVKKGEEGLLLTATGNDPSFELYFDPSPQAGSLIVQISLTSQKDTELQMYYTTFSEKEFSSVRKITREIRKGRNELLFRLPQPETYGKVRLDPGTVPGNYILHSLVIKGEPEEKLSNIP